MAMGMGFYQPEWAGPGGNYPAPCFKRKYRWIFSIQDISGNGVNSLPPAKGGRPSISFKEMQAEHLNETIFFPSKPEWKPIALTLYDIQKANENPVFSWLKRAYNPANCSLWSPSLGGSTNSEISATSLKCAQCFLNMFDGCGNLLEQWVFEHAWPQSVEFADGDMASNEVVMCDLTLRYDRAYITTPGTATPISFITILPNYNCSVTPISSSPLSMVYFHTPIAEFKAVY